MKNTIQFTKMHGAGNDFILVDDRKRHFPTNDNEWLAEAMNRRTGIGSDGLILVQPSDHAHFRMRFFNPDGGEVEMCGNGARCVSRFARDIGAAPDHMSIETVAGVLHADMLGSLVRLYLTAPHGWILENMLEVNGVPTVYSSVNTGVPHAVIKVDDIEQLDIMSTGRAIRYHDIFAPAGTNANFAMISGDQSLVVRTYERGVENETLACGTGITACALIAGRCWNMSPPIQVTCAHGDILEVNFEGTDESVENVTLTGPAVYVFTGEIEVPA